jgi:hypothetical protein
MKQTAGVPVNRLLGLYMVMEVLLYRIRLISNTTGDLYACRIVDLWSPATLSPEQRSAIAHYTEHILKIFVTPATDYKQCSQVDEQDYEAVQ